MSANRGVIRALVVLTGLLAGLLIGELVVRLKQISPARQVVRQHNLRTINGTPVWTGPGNTPTCKYHEECVKEHPERTRIAFFGTSITAGAGLSPEETFSTLLEDHLNAKYP